jgi:hypothetical protein
VFAKARCALEALAGGCAVILWHGHALGTLVTTENVRELRSWNFGMRCLQRELTLSAVQREIGRYDAGDAARVAQVIRAEASLDAAPARNSPWYSTARPS